MNFELKYQSTIIIDNFPIQCIPKMELFHPDLPQFSIMYVHCYYNNVRLYGFPTSVNFDIKENKICTAKFNFLCNLDLENNEAFKSCITCELE